MANPASIEEENISSQSLDETELIQLFNEFRRDPRVLQILSLGGENESRDREAKAILNNVEEEMRAMDCDCAAECLRSCRQMISLHKEITEYDKMLESIETMLTGYQSNLKDITSKIKLLQTESTSIQSELKDKKQMRDLLSTYVNQILITPELITTICQAPINASFLNQIQLLSKKLERAKQPGIRVYPSAKESLPELQKLHLKALHRVRDYLISSIECMKQSQTNIGILQQNLLLRNKKFYHFLLEHHPRSALEVRTHYVNTMSIVYQSKFRTYVQCLAKFSIEGAGGTEELLGQVDWGSGAATATIQSSARRLVGNLLGLSSQTEQAVLSNRGNLFSLAGRDLILQQLNDDPLLSTSTAGASNATQPTPNHPHVSSGNLSVSTQPKYYPETLFRSHQKLLMDTATSEFLFLLEFFVDPPSLRHPLTTSTTPSMAPQSTTILVDSFGSHQASPVELLMDDPNPTNDVKGPCLEGPKQRQPGRHNLATNKMKLLFDDVFQKTLTSFLQHLKDVVMNSVDCIGLLLMVILNDFSRLTMQKRKNPCLDAFLNEVQITIWPRLKILFDQHIQSIRKASPQELIESVNEQQRTHPHYITRRFAEFSSAFMVLSLRSSTMGFRDIQGIDAPLGSLITAIETLLQVMSLSVTPETATREVAKIQKILFLINNYDLILSVYAQRGLRQDRAERFKQLLQSQISSYVEIQLLSKFKDIVQFVQSIDYLLSNSKEDEIEDTTSSQSNAGPLATLNGHIPAGIDLSEMEQVARRFSTSWQLSIHDLHRDAIQNFTNFTTGMEILKQVLTELLLYYTRFQRIVKRVYPSQSERQMLPWIKQLVPTNAILLEIKTYSKTF